MVEVVRVLLQQGFGAQRVGDRLGASCSSALIGARAASSLSLTLKQKQIGCCQDKVGGRCLASTAAQ